MLARTAPSGARHAAGSLTAWDWVRHVLVVGWLVALACGVAFGSRAASWEDARELVRSGAVDSVSVSYEVPAGARGFSLVEVRWQRGPLNYVAEVVQVSGRGQGVGARGAADRSVPRVRSAPSSLLASLNPDVDVVRDDRLRSGGRLIGWYVPSAVSMSVLLLMLSGLMALAASPRAWRVTPWGWFWLLSTPVGQVAFLLLSGPTVGLPGPRDAGRRLTGGWAMLISMALLEAARSL